MDRRGFARAGGATLVALLLGGCGSGASADCEKAAGASVCLSRGSSIRLTATGLEPGSPVAYSIEPGGSSSEKSQPPLVAGPDGHFPAAGAVMGLVGVDRPMTMTVVVTPRSGAPTTVTLRR